MQRRHFIALAGLAALAGCSSRLNPFTWFGGGRRAERVEPVEVRLDPRPLVPQVARLDVDRHPSGAIIRVAGLPPRQGWYDAQLVRVPDAGADVLAYQLHAWPPSYRTLVSTPRSRELVVAAFVSTDKLAGIREIRVSGELNTLVARR